MAETLQDAVNSHTHTSVKQKSDGVANAHPHKGTEPDAQELVIASLRSQIQDLFSQVSQLNNKLVQSYDRVSNLEDDLHVAASNLRSSSLKISQLELERTQHISALSTGLLVEKSHVTAELNRLMEKATDEAAQRGQAESARADIEKDLDDLSATLFGQANTMVAEARYAQSLSERKVEDAERALKGAEEVVRIMQQQMQTLQAEKEEAERQTEEMRSSMGRGKWVRVSQKYDIAAGSSRLLSSHTPYQDFLLFVAHLRSIHPTSPSIPAMSTLLPLPFLARLLVEDSEPTVRLDLAPSLNWLSRRSVLSAIHNGQLIIEPVSSVTLLQELVSTSQANSAPMTYAINGSYNNISCALCGTLIFPVSDGQSGHPHPHPRPPTHPFSALTLTRGGSGGNASWSAASSLFKKPLTYSANTSPPATPSSKQTHSATSLSHPQQVHVFRISSPQGVSIPTPFPLTLSSTMNTSYQPSHYMPGGQHNNAPSRTSQIYPLCLNGWCLTRLRTTCSLWAFVRTCIVEKVWEEEIPFTPLKAAKETEAEDDGLAEKPPLPPRRRGLWGMASALGERAASWTEGEKERPKEIERMPERETKRLPPIHPTGVKPATGLAPPAGPPPLPKRSQVRGINPPATIRPSSARYESLAPAANGSSPNGYTSLRHSPCLEAKTPDFVPEGSQESLTQSTTGPDSQTAPGAGAEPEPFLTTRGEPTSSISPITRISAHLVPLPDSRPNTPVSVPATNIDKLQSEALAVTRTALPGPPPLPRRAAARAPRSISAIGAPEVLPSHQDAPGPTTTSTVSTTTSNTKSLQKDAEAVDATVLPPEEMPSRPNPVAEEAESVPEYEYPTNGENLGVPPTASANGKRNEPPSLASNYTESEAITESPTPVYNTISDDGEQAPFVKGDKDDDTEVYVGDATWEERTWKELVKLRGGMFWARIGAVH